MFSSKAKIEQDACYHIYNRGNNRSCIFFEPCNYAFFLSRLEKYVVPSCELYAYCLMSNHFHLFLKVENKILFEKGIKNFLISYAKSVNKKYDRVGSLFQGRYKAAEIDTDSYFTRIITYIHQNPLAAGIVSNLEDYQHSSYNDYLSDENTIIAKSKVIDWFNGREEFIKAHK